MYTNILAPIALDHGHDVGAALDVAHKLLNAGGKITAIHVTPIVLCMLFGDETAA